MTILSSAPLQPNVKPSPVPRHERSALSTYEFPAGLPGTLQRDLGWTWGYSARALTEYRRFLILAAECGHPVTPSRAVDEVWHRHLTHSRDYWERLTPLLPEPLHHEPGSGSADDAERHRRQYAQTLGAYRARFGEEPPADLWPQGEPHPGRGVIRVVAVLAALIALALTMSLFIPATLLLACVVVLAFAVIHNASGHRARGGNRPQQGAGVTSGGSGSVGVDGSSSDGGSDGGSGCGGGCGN